MTYPRESYVAELSHSATALQEHLSVAKDCVYFDLCEPHNQVRGAYWAVHGLVEWHLVVT